MFARPGLCGMGIGRLGLVAASAYAQSVIVSQAYDPHYANVSLLLHFDGSNGSTTFTDASPTPKTVTASGNAQISTAHSQFGGASGYFDGSGDFISTASSSDFSLGTGDFTLEFFTRYTGGTTGGYNTIFFLTDGSQRLEIRLSDAGFGYSLQANLATGSTIGEVLTASGTTRTTLQNVWAHIAVSRASGTTRIFVNGVLGGSTTLAYNIASAATVRVGATNDSGQSYLGFVDDFRVTKGVARYTGNFTPPTEAFPNPVPPYAQSVIANVSGVTM